MSRRHYASKYVEVDVTEEVEAAARERAGDLVEEQRSRLTAGGLATDDLIVRVRRACRARGATKGVVLRELLRALDNDALSREVRSLLGWPVTPGRRLPWAGGPS